MAKGGVAPSGKREVKFTERNSEAELTAGSLGSRRPVFPIGAPERAAPTSRAFGLGPSVAGSQAASEDGASQAFAPSARHRQALARRDRMLARTRKTRRRESRARFPVWPTYRRSAAAASANHGPTGRDDRARGSPPRARGVTVQVTTTCGRLLQRLVGQLGATRCQDGKTRERKAPVGTSVHGWRDATGLESAARVRRQ